MPNRQLLLLRHAKAVPGEGMEDIDRPLAPRGEEAAERMGRYMAGHGLAPDLVLCSPARRTRQTWEIAAQALPATPVHIIDALYDFGDGAELLAVLRRHGGSATRLLLVTHNPATQKLALSLAEPGHALLRRQIAEDYPTAGLAVLSFATAGWEGVGAGQGRLEAFLRPRQLG